MKAWNKDELEYLENLADDVSFATLVQMMQSKAEEMNWPIRSAEAIRSQMHKRHLHSVSRCGTETTAGGVAEILGVPATRVIGWLKNPDICAILKPKRHLSRVKYVNRREWRSLARQMPQVFGGIPADRLFDLIEDYELAKAVAATYPLPRSDHRIRCVETGRIWPSAAAASRELHVDKTTISLAIREGRPVPSLGMTFKALRLAGSPSRHSHPLTNPNQ